MWGRPPSAGSDVRQRVEQIMAEEKIDEKAALKKVAKERGSVEERGVPRDAEEQVSGVR